MQEPIALLQHQHHPIQLADQIVRVASWQANERFDVYPVGSKPKRLIVAPDKPLQPFIIGRHNYLFKVAADYRRHQLWSEVIAYDLSRSCGVQAPPCFVATDDNRADVGVLMEFFYGYPGTVSPRFIHGTDINQARFRDYDERTGRPHCVQRNIGICRGLKIAGAEEWWAKTLTFDALIGNVDRHAENWGLLRHAKASDGWSLAPAFDNGTSLGYECLDDALEAAASPERIARHLRKGRHHCTWEPLTGRHGDHLIGLCGDMFQAYPALQEAMASVILLTDEQIDRACNRCVEFDVRVRFSAARAAYVGNLVRARRDALATAFRA